MSIIDFSFDPHIQGQYIGEVTIKTDSDNIVFRVTPSFTNRVLCDIDNGDNEWEIAVVTIEDGEFYIISGLSSENEDKYVYSGSILAISNTGVMKWLKLLNEMREHDRGMSLPRFPEIEKIERKADGITINAYTGIEVRNLLIDGKREDLLVDSNYIFGLAIIERGRLYIVYYDYEEEEVVLYRFNISNRMMDEWKEITSK